MGKLLIENFSRFDDFLFLQIFGWNGRKIFDRSVYWISRSGDGYLYGLVGIVLLFLHNELALKILLAGLIAFGIELPVHKIIKHWIRRSRPFKKLSGISVLIAPPDEYSFPSGHTAAAFVIAVLFIANYPFLQIPLLTYATLVGFSRVYLGVHYPTDILAGGILGIFCAQAGLSIIF